MDEKFWYYVKDNTQNGPVPESKIKEMLANGELGPETLVWSSPMKQWAPASTIEIFSNIIVSTKPQPAQQPAPEPQKEVTSQEPMPQEEPEPTIKERPELAQDETVSQVRPGVRFWARYFDYFLFAFVFGFVFGIIEPSVVQIPEIVLSMLLIFIWIFIESYLLSSWGTTPGKWLLKTTVRDSAGKKLSFSNALKRAFTVWWRGMALGIPIIIIITLIISYNKLKKDGITPWDSEGNFVITHEKISGLRILVTVLCFVAFFILMVIGVTAG
jgi:uncharacterized RDD family membrane protein YckC